MFKINLITVGDIKEKYLKDAISEYSKRISRFATISIIEIKEHIASSSSPKDIEIALEKDALELMKKIKGYAICLDINGKEYTSIEYANYIKNLMLTNSEISIIIGASNGIANIVKEKCRDRISFSKMTFPHQLMRVIFLEQTYRAFTIMNNISYHK